MSDKNNAKFVPRNKSKPQSPLGAEVVGPFKQSPLGGDDAPDKPDEEVDGKPIPSIDES